MRSSHVTWLRSRLFSTMTIRRGSDHSFQYLEIVIITLRPFICMAPSPMKAMTTRSGNAGHDAVFRQAFGQLPERALRVDGVGRCQRALLERFPPIGHTGLDPFPPMIRRLLLQQREQCAQSDGTVA